MDALDFDSLCAEREELRQFVLIHPISVEAFREKDKPWFRRQEAPDKPDPKKRTVRHLTTTASSLQSLADVPLYENRRDPPAPCPPDREVLERSRRDIGESFTQSLLAAGPEEWLTEDQPLVYTKVRTLPIVLHLGSDDTLRRFSPEIKKLTQDVWAQLKPGNLSTQGIAELAGKPNEAYPPNAFHTYWAIRLLREYKERGHLLESLSSSFATKEAVARLWARRTLATQTALISSVKRRVDAQQLAWALSTDVLCGPDDGDQPTTSDHQHSELYAAALKAFFDEQIDGHWKLYEPLFHYQKAGNAYCYMFETLSELLSLALLQHQRGRLIRDMLRPHAANLVSAWHYARDTALELDRPGAKGWCSGHHPHRTKPEGWATASVFSYLQNLRCLIGVWTAEEAKRGLRVSPSDGTSVDKAVKNLGDRGDTWSRPGTRTVGQQFAMSFLNPIEAGKTERPRIDPDAPLVNEARSALLFGPPGTGKTTVVRNLARALEWDFVEVLPSDFLSEGIDQVPKAADAIFKRLMELDECVILFDEIDELIRVRGGDGSDPFGRFLTTSMLPKLAKLWEQRRVLFFVNTNDVETADPAIKRSQRFDAAMFVPPPSFEKKVHELEKQLAALRVDPATAPAELTKEAVEKASWGEIGPDPALGVFAMMRWDQIAELAHGIADAPEGKRSQALISSLREIGAELARSDWKKANLESSDPAGRPPGSRDTQAALSGMFARWCTQDRDERRDFRNSVVLKLDPDLELPDGWEPYVEDRPYLEVTPAVDKALHLNERGELELDGGDWIAVDARKTFSFVTKTDPQPG